MFGSRRPPLFISLCFVCIRGGCLYVFAHDDDDDDDGNEDGVIVSWYVSCWAM